MRPADYDITENQNYHYIKKMWATRHETVTRIFIRNALSMIRLDIAEHVRWSRK